MAFLSTNELGILLPKCITPFNPIRLKEVGYELSLGNQIFRTDAKEGTREILEGKYTQIKIMPGQFALLLTGETITIPNDKIAFISIKFGTKIKGLINVSGFHVDPGFNGQLIFSVYNAGPTPIIMDKGKPYFMIWLAKETSPAGTYKGEHQGQNEISANLVGQLSGELASPNILLKRFKRFDDKLKYIIGFTTIIAAACITIVLNLNSKNSALRKAINLE